MTRTYDILSQTVQNALHALEIRSLYETYKEAFGNDLALQVTFSTLFKDIDTMNYRHVLNDLLYGYYSTDRRTDETILYYLIAGVGIRSIVVQLNVGQTRVYRIIKSDPERIIQPRYALGTFFSNYPEVLDRLQNTLKFMNVLNNHRIRP